MKKIKKIKLFTIRKQFYRRAKRHFILNQSCILGFCFCEYKDTIQEIPF